MRSFTGFLLFIEFGPREEGAQCLLFPLQKQATENITPKWYELYKIKKYILNKLFVILEKMDSCWYTNNVAGD